jgi:hypothetical protein
LNTSAGEKGIESGIESHGDWAPAMLRFSNP